MPDYCNHRGKEIFPDRVAANEAAKALTRRRKRGKSRAYVYHCEFCNGWHVTSLPPSSQKKHIENLIHSRYEVI